MGAGFEGPSEILFLGKKLLAIPMKNQYEQQCNAAALKDIGIKILNKIGNDKISELKEWIKTDDAKMIPFPDHTSQIVDEILKVS